MRLVLIDEYRLYLNPVVLGGGKAMLGRCRAGGAGAVEAGRSGKGLGSALPARRLTVRINNTEIKAMIYRQGVCQKLCSVSGNTPPYFESL